MDRNVFSRSVGIGRSNGTDRGETTFKSTYAKGVTDWAKSSRHANSVTQQNRELEILENVVRANHPLGDDRVADRPQPNRAVTAVRSNSRVRPGCDFARGDLEARYWQPRAFLGRAFSV